MKKLVLFMVGFFAIGSFTAFTPLSSQHVIQRNKVKPPVGYYVGSITISTGGDYDGFYHIYSLPNNHSRLTYMRDVDGNNYLITGTFDVNLLYASIKFNTDPTATVYSDYVIIYEDVE